MNHGQLRNWGSQKPPCGTPIDRNHPLANGLVMFCALAEAGGGITADAVGGGIGTLTNGPLWRPTGGGMGVYFDGVDDYVQFAGPGNAFDGKFVSVFAIAKWIPGSNGYPRIVDRQYNGQFAAYLNEATSAMAMALFYSPTVKLDVVVSNSIPQNEWVRLMWTWDGANVRCYLNGRPWGNPSAFAATGLATSTQPLRIGQRVDAGSNRAFNGEMACVGLWNRCLQPAEIAALSAEPYCLFAGESSAAAESVGRVLVDGSLAAARGTT
jgi:hypothetical protein